MSGKSSKLPVILGNGNIRIVDPIKMLIVLRVKPRDALTGVWVFDETLPVIGDLTEVKLVTEDAVAALPRCRVAGCR